MQHLYEVFKTSYNICTVLSSDAKLNAITLNSWGLAYDSYINAGAIMTAPLIKTKFGDSARFLHCVEVWERLAAASTTHVHAILVWKNTAGNYFALAYLMRSKGAFAEGAQWSRLLTSYLMMWSLWVDAKRMSVTAASLANGGQS